MEWVVRETAEGEHVLSKIKRDIYEEVLLSW